ncbi:MAG: hypothetical protein JNM56_32475 [Planctomycetia bacterium]|nr:hypothetical protein [Planctomycetia bacterium]
MRVSISQRVGVYKRDPERPWYMEAKHESVNDPDTLAGLHNTRYEDERFTDFIGGMDTAFSEQYVRENPNDEAARDSLERFKLENAVASTLRPGGYLTFVYKPDVNELWVVTEYETTRELEPRQLDFLKEYTTGQWSDGIGENFLSESETRYGLIVDCCPRGSDVEAVVEIVN